MIDAGLETTTYRPLTGARAALRRSWRILSTSRDLAIGLVLTALLAMVLLFPGLLAGHPPNDIDPSRALLAPSAQHWFGTDEIGRDVFSRVIWGTRVTLGMVSVALAIPALIGFVLGLVAGFVGGPIDNLVSRTVDLILSFPSMITAVIITGILGPGLRNGVLALCIVYIPMFYRVARSATMTEANLSYVEAARSLGVRDATTMFKHVSRNIVGQLVIQFTVLFPAAIQIAAALGYLGLGVQPPTPDWGAILNQGKNYLFNAPWISVFPGLSIVVAALGLTLLGRGLQNILDPRGR
ncbi:MAG: ABC transporter permease [Trueperaceae bacterium]